MTPQAPQGTKHRTSPRHTRASTQATRLTSTTPSKGTNKSTSPNKKARQASPKRNTITIKKVLLTSSSGSTISSTNNSLGKDVPHGDQLDIELESDLSVQSGPEVRDEDSEFDMDNSSSESITDGDDIGVPDFDQIINTPQPKTLVTSSGKLTARQRAMLDETSTNEPIDSDNLLLPTKRALTEEELLQKSEVARRRKHQREQALEERKVATIHRILAKQNTRRAIGQKGRPKGVSAKEQEFTEGALQTDVDAARSSQQHCEEYLRKPMQRGSIRYHSRGTGSYLVVPAEVLVFPEPRLIKSVECARCGKAKQYNHSVTGLPVCSLECYKRIKT